MAVRRSNYSSALQNNQSLRQFILNGVTPTEITLGTGSYGSVLEVKETFLAFDYGSASIDVCVRVCVFGGQYQISSSDLTTEFPISSDFLLGPSDYYSTVYEADCLLKVFVRHRFLYLSR